CDTPQARALVGAGAPPAHPRLAAPARHCLLQGCHPLSPGGAGSLARLAADPFAGVLDALALVRLGRAQRADLRAHLAEQLLVVALDGENDLPFDLGVDP